MCKVNIIFMITINNRISLLYIIMRVIVSPPSPLVIMFLHNNEFANDLKILKVHSMSTENYIVCEAQNP